MKKLKTNARLFTLGSIGYAVIEILWRGHTHWSMMLTGGTCFVTLYRFYRRYEKIRLMKRCVCGSLIITALELCCGLIVNKRLKLRVWDYSDCRFNFKGQICALYSFLWALLCIPVSGLCRLIARHEEKSRLSPKNVEDL